jgi:cupin 2 domain-containing protein
MGEGTKRSRAEGRYCWKPVTVAMIQVRNIFDAVSKTAGQERFEKLFENDVVKIERIVSEFYASPANFWYDQLESEWVIILRGEAVLEFEGAKRIEMKAGDYVTIPRHVKHRVHRTGPETVWLAVHVKERE